MSAADHLPVSGIILAGGEGRRMGGRDKGWLDLKGEPLVSQVIGRIQNQVSKIIISANRNLEAYSSLPHLVIQDSTPFQGPLGGIAACLKMVNTEYALVVPTDAPLIPEDLVAQLIHHAPAKLILCHDGKRLQPLFGLYHRSLVSSIEAFLQRGDRKLGLWCEQQTPKIVTISDTLVFTNLNTPQDLANFEKNHTSK